MRGGIVLLLNRHVGRASYVEQWRVYAGADASRAGTMMCNRSPKTERPFGSVPYSVTRIAGWGSRISINAAMAAFEKSLTKRCDSVAAIILYNL